MAVTKQTLKGSKKDPMEIQLASSSKKEKGNQKKRRRAKALLKASKLPKKPKNNNNNSFNPKRRRVSNQKPSSFNPTQPIVPQAPFISKGYFLEKNENRSEENQTLFITDCQEANKSFLVLQKHDKDLKERTKNRNDLKELFDNLVVLKNEKETSSFDVDNLVYIKSWGKVNIPMDELLKAANNINEKLEKKKKIFNNEKSIKLLMNYQEGAKLMDAKIKSFQEKNETILNTLERQRKFLLLEVESQIRRLLKIDLNGTLFILSNKLQLMFSRIIEERKILNASTTIIESIVTDESFEVSEPMIPIVESISHPINQGESLASEPAIVDSTSPNETQQGKDEGEIVPPATANSESSDSGENPSSDSGEDSLSISDNEEKSKSLFSHVSGFDGEDDNGSHFSYENSETFDDPVNNFSSGDMKGLLKLNKNSVKGNLGDKKVLIKFKNVLRQYGNDFDWGEHEHVKNSFITTHNISFFDLS